MRRAAQAFQIKGWVAAVLILVSLEQVEGHICQAAIQCQCWPPFESEEKLFWDQSTILAVGLWQAPIKCPCWIANKSEARLSF